MYKLLSTLVKEEAIPPILQDYLLDKCPYCGSFIITSENLRSRRCMNYFCLGHAKERAVVMFKYFNLVGYGPATCEQLMRDYRVQDHMDLIPCIFSSKPSVYLWEVAFLCQIPGFSTKLEEIFIGYNSFEDYFSKTAYPPKEILKHKERLLKCEKYFDIKPSLAKDCINVMITGSINGYTKRDLFIDQCNKIVGNTIRIKLNGKGLKNDVLICENKNSTTEKVVVARANGIPIMTSVEFLNWLASQIESKVKHI